MLDKSDFSAKFQDKKLKHLGLNSPLRNVDLPLLNQYLNMGIISFHGQKVSKTSRRYSVLKVLAHDYWFRLNQPISVTTLMMETKEPSDFILRLLRKGVELGLYVQSGDEYLPTFEFTDTMAGWFQQSGIPFSLQSNPYLIRSELPSWRFIADFMSLVGVRDPGESAASCVVILWLVALEITHKGPVTATLLSEKTGFNKSTISNLVDHLVSAGYLSRQPDRFDERSHRLSLTLPDDYRADVQALFSRYFSI